MDLGSGIGKSLFRIPDPALGVKKAPDPGSGSVTLIVGSHLSVLNENTLYHTAGFHLIENVFITASVLF
jgi:hypothetical protein